MVGLAGKRGRDGRPDTERQKGETKKKKKYECTIIGFLDRNNGAKLAGIKNN